MSIYLDSVPSSQREKLRMAFDSELRQAVENERKYIDQVKLQNYKETYGIEDVAPPPKSNIEAKDNYNYQIQLLFLLIYEYSFCYKFEYYFQM